MFSKKPILAWIIGSIAMFSASYFWHGIFLNDLEKIQFSKTIFLSLASLAYLIIGFIVSFAFIQEIFMNYEKSPLLRGALVGGISGACIYIMAVVVGVSYSASHSIEHILLDFSWQIVEQAIGGMIVGLVHFYVSIYEFNKAHKF